MNREDKIIQDLIGLEKKSIPNKDFTLETVKKIQEAKALENKRPSMQYSTLLAPVLVYTILFVLFWLIKMGVIVFQVDIDQVSVILDKGMDYFFNPIVVAISISFILLFYFDGYMEKRKEHIKYG